METEAHVYALAIAASTLLAFYPFMMVMLSFCRDVLHWPAAMQAVYLALGDFFAGEPGEFIVRNLQPWMVPRLHVFSMILLLFTANGIFEPLEVALNRAWGVEKNRTYLKNQLISLGLIFACGGLALLSLMLTAANSRWITDVTGSHGWVETLLKLAVFKVAALAASILALFVIYWLLPNRKVEARRVAPVAIVVGLVHGTAEVRQSAGVAVAAGQAQQGIHRLSALGHDSDLEFRGGHGGAGGRALDGAAGPGGPAGLAKPRIGYRRRLWRIIRRRPRRLVFLRIRSKGSRDLWRRWRRYSGRWPIR